MILSPLSPRDRTIECLRKESTAISRSRLACALVLFSAAPVLRAAVPTAESPTVEDRLDAGWQIQRRWTAVTANGSFVYDFALKAWNGAGTLKEAFTRSVRVFNRGDEHRSEVLSATRDGRDVTDEARADEAKPARPGRPKRKDDFPSPFDPRFRDRYAFSEAPGPDGSVDLVFRPRSEFDGALEGRARFDVSGALRRVAFTLAKRPRFTRRLDFTIEIGTDGYPARVESDGEISLVVWKRKFESTLLLRDVRAGEKEAR